ncbi:MAG: RluA family pseudouridine synthase [Chthoniobacterales bacterium]
MIERIVTAERAGMRLDQFLAAELPQFSRSRIQQLIRDGFVTLNKARPRPRDAVRSGDRVCLTEPQLTAIDAKPEEIGLDILHEDDDLLVINKPAGLVVHPGAGNREHTLVNALLAHCRDLSGIGGKERPGIVHRLDKETSGCIVIAKSDTAHRALAAQFAGRTAEKVYLALIRGTLPKRSGVIDAPIARHKINRKKMAVARSGGRAARTEYRVLQIGNGISLLECELHSGRTHQIRVHLHHIGHPVLGDKLYGSAGRGVYPRQMLHAWKLGFAHPRTEKQVRFEAPVPADFAAAIPLRDAF